MIKAVIFDFDGVVANTAGNFTKTLEEIYGKYKKKYNGKKEFHADIKGFYKEFINTPPLEKNNISLEKFSDEAINNPNENLSEKDLIPGIKETLIKLKKEGIKTALATNSPRSRANKALKELRIEELFDFTITPCEVSFPKPNPEMIIETTKWLNIKPEEAIFIDDSEEAIQAGIEAGTKTALFTKKDKETIENKKINLIIDDIKKLDIKKF